jgi:hypothetical protein
MYVHATTTARSWCCPAAMCHVRIPIGSDDDMTPPVLCKADGMLMLVRDGLMANGRTLVLPLSS